MRTLLLGSLVIAATTGTATAATELTGESWCKTKGSADEVLITSGDAELRWEADGDLTIVANLGQLSFDDDETTPLWSSNTSSLGGYQLCEASNGTLSIKNSAGDVLWSKAGARSNGYQTTLSIDGCSVASTTTYIACSGGTSYGCTPVLKTISNWTVSGVCPGSGQSSQVSGWCVSNDAELTIAQTPWAELMWQTDGELVLQATGLDAGMELWSSNTAGSANKLCFESNGKLVTYNYNSTTGAQTQVGTALGSTVSGAVAYTMSLDDCQLRIDTWEGTANTYYDHNTCPQEWANPSWTKTASSTNQVLLENDDAELVFGTSNGLALQTKDGDLLWSTGAVAAGYQLKFKSSGDLQVTTSSGTVTWSAGSAGANIIKLDRCKLSVRIAGSTTYFTRGDSSCNKTSRALDGSFLYPSGYDRILQTEEAYLAWDSGGSLVLKTTGGSQVWTSNTSGTGVAVKFQTDGNLTVKNVFGNSAYAANNVVTDASKLVLGDECTLTLQDASGNVEKTINSSCDVANYTFDKTDGNDDFTIGMRNEMKATTVSGNSQLWSVTALEATLFSVDVTLFSVSALQTELDDSADQNGLTFSIYGEATVQVNKDFEKTFFKQSKTFPVGPVPVTIEAGVTGKLALALAYNNNNGLSLTPSAGLYATVSAGVGYSNDYVSAQAGIKGELTLIELSLPISLSIANIGSNPQWTVQGDLTLTALSGALKLFAEAKVKVWFAEVGVEYSYKIIEWTGVELTRTLFSKSGSF